MENKNIDAPKEISKLWRKYILTYLCIFLFVVIGGWLSYEIDFEQFRYIAIVVVIVGIGKLNIHDLRCPVCKKPIPHVWSRFRLPIPDRCEFCGTDFILRSNNNFKK